MKHKFTVKWAMINRMRSIFRMPVCLMLVILGGNQLFAQPVNMVFNPSATTVLLNQTFTVDVAADFTSAGTLNVIEGYVNFNPLDLEVLSTPTVPAGTSTALPGVSVPFASVATMNSEGRIDHGRFTSSPSGHPNADFTLFTITFRVLRVPPSGNTALSFNTVFPRQTTALEGATNVLNQAINTTITISSCTPPTAAINNTPTCNGQPFNLFLASATGAAPYDIVVNGITYTDITPGAGGTFTTINPPTERVWPANPVPSDPNLNDGAAIEVGVKFRSSVAGFIKGIRFYRGASTAGTYTGKLYNSLGSLVTSRQFTTVTANSWNEITFTSPIQITANTTYTASVYSTAGNYSQDDNYFNVNGTITSGSLLALGEGVDGSNGVYNFPAPSGGAFPTDTWIGHSPNYWVDVLFTPSTYIYNLTSITDNNGCTNSGSPLQSLVVNSVDCATLPVTLLNLSATPQGKNIMLRWSTASEFENKGFEIQRIYSGGKWEGIAFVNGAGNSSVQTNYSHIDKDLFPRRYNYRLKQVDIDGKYVYSMIVSAEIEGKADFSLGQNYPNPFRLVTTIQYTLPETSKVNLTIYDLNGRVMKVLVNERRDAGTHAENFHVGGLPTGVYYYKIQAGNFSAVKKLVLQ